MPGRKKYNFSSGHVNILAMQNSRCNFLYKLLLLFIFLAFLSSCITIRHDEVNFIKTSDDVEIAFNHYKTGHDKVIIVAHGFYNNKDTAIFQRISQIFTKDYDVIAFDFRGHGQSSGKFTWTAREWKDLRAVVEYAKMHNYKKIGVIGFSLGATVALIEGARDKDINSIIAISGARSFYKINYHFWRKEMIEDLKLNFGKAGEGKGVRPGNPFLHKISSIDIVDKVNPIPIFFIHGEDDWLIRPVHSEKLFEKAKEKKKLYILKSAGHAERIFAQFPDDFSKQCLDWFKETL